MCLVALAGMSLGAVPTVAVAAPAPQAPLLSNTVVGLKQGARGAEVTALQSALLAAGVQVAGGADGIYGPATKSAVTAFQSRSGLSTTGEIDDATASALGLAGGAPAASSSSSGLAVGAQGDAVKQAQQALMDFGVYVPGGADGVFGPATKTAVSSFQRWNGLPISGVIDAATAARLKLGSGGGATAPTPPASSSGQTFVGLANGARGENVKVLQRALIAAGISVRGGADGVFGPETKAALTSYQNAQGLGATGVVDAAVADRLALGSSTSAPAPAPPSTSSPYVGLAVGSTGPLVKDLQRALMGTGLSLLGGADGVFGSATAATLTLFQKTNGTPQTGQVGAQDASVLALGSSGGPQGVSNQSGFAAFGERGDRVRSLQQSLINAGISFSGGADGIFGASTAGAVLAFQRREGLPATGKVDEATANRLGTAAAPAPTPPSSAGISIDVFPVQGQCWFGDTFQAPRGGGRTHEGVDVIAAKGKLLYAVVSGRVSKIYTDSPTAISGNGLRIAQDNGTYFTYLHMDSFAPGIAVGVPVTAGQVIGYVGETGNAPTPHLHFEVHPNGGGPVNPYSIIKSVDACNVTAPRS